MDTKQPNKFSVLPLYSSQYSVNYSISLQFFFCCLVLLCLPQSRAHKSEKKKTKKIHIRYTTLRVQRKRKSYYTYHFIRSGFTFSTGHSNDTRYGRNLHTLNTIFLATFAFYESTNVEDDVDDDGGSGGGPKEKLRNFRFDDGNFYSIELSRRVRFK